jgi:hypothetical protein
MTPSEPQNRQAVDQTSRDPHAAVGGLSVSSLSEPTSVMVIVASQLSRWLDFCATRLSVAVRYGADTTGGSPATTE